MVIFRFCFAIKFDLRHSKMINSKDKVEIARQNCNNDWRSDFPTLFDRFKRLCLSDEFSDVDFVFNKGLSTETVWILFICYKYLLFLANSCPFLCSKSCIRSFWEAFCLWWRWKETPGFISKLSKPFRSNRWVVQRYRVYLPSQILGIFMPVNFLCPYHSLITYS